MCFQILTIITDLGGDQQAAVLKSGVNQLVFDMIEDLLNTLEGGAAASGMSLEGGAASGPVCLSVARCGV